MTGFTNIKVSVNISKESGEGICLLGIESLIIIRTPPLVARSLQYTEKLGPAISLSKIESESQVSVKQTM